MKIESKLLNFEIFAILSGSPTINNLKKLCLFIWFCFLLINKGDRMWYFALSMYFIVINENSLLITALNGFIVNLVAIFLGALIGNLIDKHQRINGKWNWIANHVIIFQLLMSIIFFSLLVVRISLIVQNFTVGLSCIAVIFLLHFKEFSQTTWNGSFFYIVQGNFQIFKKNNGRLGWKE